MFKSDDISALIPALIEARGKVPQIAKTAENPYFNSMYVSLDELVDAVTPALQEHGLAVMQFPTLVDGVPGLTTVLAHTSGQYIGSTMPLGVPLNVKAQEQGSAITYARRYALMALLNVVGDEDDDDGNQAQQAEDSTALLDRAKRRLWRAIKRSGADVEDFSWVKEATVADIDRINGVAEALEAGKAVK